MKARWTNETELLATIADRIHALGAIVIKVAGGEPNELEPYPRPFEVEKPAEQVSTLADFTNFVEGL